MENLIALLLQYIRRKLHKISETKYLYKLFYLRKYSMWCVRRIVSFCFNSFNVHVHVWHQYGWSFNPIWRVRRVNHTATKQRKTILRKIIQINCCHHQSYWKKIYNSICNPTNWLLFTPPIYVHPKFDFMWQLVFQRWNWTRFLALLWNLWITHRIR